MQRGRHLILIALLLVLSAAALTLVFAVSGAFSSGNDGHLTCYSRDGDIIYSDDVEYANLGSGGVWYVDGGVKITGDCVFIPDER